MKASVHIPLCAQRSSALAEFGNGKHNTMYFNAWFFFQFGPTAGLP
jgi:hypothetical protein